MAPFEDNVHISSGELHKFNESAELKCLLKAHLESREVQTHFLFFSFKLKNLTILGINGTFQFSLIGRWWKNYLKF